MAEWSGEGSDGPFFKKKKFEPRSKRKEKLKKWKEKESTQLGIFYLFKSICRRLKL
jgi:hypothetical protein